MAPKSKHFLPDGTLFKGATHKMGNIIMTGAVHSPDSQILTHSNPKNNSKPKNTMRRMASFPSYSS